MNMERVTYWNDDLGCWSYHCASGDAAKRLAAYEDTGLTPEEIIELCTDDVVAVAKLFRRMIKDGSIDRIEQLVQADDDGRLVVLPCKVGESFWQIEKDRKPCRFGYVYDECDCIGCEDPCDSEEVLVVRQKRCNTIAEVVKMAGKTIYLTKEEAEAALAEKGKEDATF